MPGITSGSSLFSSIKLTVRFSIIILFDIITFLIFDTNKASMRNSLTSQQIGKKIKKLRLQNGFSQQDLSRILGISRSSVAQIELGNRHISILELVKLSDYLGFSIEQFLTREYEAVNNLLMVSEPEVELERMRISKPTLNWQKLETVLVYILERCGGKPNMGEGMISGLLYFCDFNYYEIYEEHLTGLQYLKQTQGPSAVRIGELLNQMVLKGSLIKIKTEYLSLPQFRYIPLVKADLTMLIAAEKEVIDRVVDQLSDWNATSLNKYAREDMPWKASEPGKEIDYELVFYRRSPFSVRVYNEDAESV